MCLSKSMGKDLFWRTKAPWRGVCCCGVPAAPRVTHGTSSLLEKLSHIPEDESQELGTAQHSLGTLADGVLQTLGCSSSPLKCSSRKMQNMQVSRGNLTTVLKHKKFMWDNTSVQNLLHLLWFLFPISFSLHSCMTALLNPITLFLSIFGLLTWSFWTCLLSCLHKHFAFRWWGFFCCCSLEAKLGISSPGGICSSMWSIPGQQCLPSHCSLGGWEQNDCCLPKGALQ